MPFDATPHHPFDDDFDADRWLKQWMLKHMSLGDMVVLYVEIGRSRIVGERPHDPRLSIKPWERRA